ncbi:MAG: DUF3999 domain-containing protein, partial [Synergistaceae bacterium]|nr:DUF3999 domain-containing protein [Synergistaceae bacterium]
MTDPSDTNIKIRGIFYRTLCLTLYRTLCRTIRASLILCAVAVVTNGAPASAARNLPADGKPEAFEIGDFAVKYKLDAEIEGRIYRLRLDENIFRNLRQSYERDLAIFNASGDAIP